MSKFGKFVYSFCVTFLLLYLIGGLTAQTAKPAEPIVAPIEKPDIDPDKAKDLQIYALTNRVARSDYNAQVEKFNAIPEIKALVDEMQTSAQKYTELRKTILADAGIKDADMAKYDIDVSKRKIMLLPSAPDIKKP